jgi:chaperone required for assembly of F1-ATPase
VSNDNPISKAQALSRPALPKRFYTVVATEQRADGIAVLLDGRPLRTPGRRPLTVAIPALAEAIAAEWRAQGETIDPAAMPVTRIVNTALDGVADRADAVRADIARFAETDLICYRAGDPEGLVELQRRHWDPLCAWARDELGLGFVLAEGVMHVAQPPASLARAADLLLAFDPLGLAALHVLTTLTGSLVIALAVTRGRLTPDQGWTAAHVDEDWQISHWGEDAEARRRREMNRREFDAAVLVAMAAGAGGKPV